MSEHIKVTILNVDYNNVCGYYNQHKPSTFNEIKQLDRVEGGFSIDLLTKNQKLDINENIKQVRWNNKHLITKWSYIPFSSEETKLLFESLVSIYGNDKIFLTSESIN